MAHAAFLFLLAILSSALAAYDGALDPNDVAEAVRIGQSRIDAPLAQFHRPYRIAVNQAPVDAIEVVTPFRQIVIAAEMQTRAGNGLFTQREGLALAAARGNQIQIVLEATFHPLNTFVGVPAYEIALLPAASGPAIGAIVVERVPRYALGSEPGRGPGTGQPLAGGTVTATFDGAALNASGRYDVVIRDSGKELARRRLDLAALR